MFISCSCLSSLWGSKCSWFIVFNVRIVARQWHFISPSVIERKHHTLDQMAEKARQIDAPFLGVFVVEQGKIWMPIARWQGNTRSPTVKVCTNKAILCWAHLLLTNSQLTSRFRCSQKLQSFHWHLYFNTPLKFFVYQIFIGRSATQSHTMLGCGAPHLFKQFLHKCWEVLQSMPCNASEILLHKRTPRGGKTGGRILSLPPWSGLQDASAWPGLKKQLKFGITMERTLHWDCSQRCHPVQDLKAFVHCVCNVNYA